MTLRVPTRVLRFALGSLAVLALTAPAQPLAAQTAPPAAPASRLLQLTIVNIKPGMMNAYVDYQKTEIVPALQKAGVKWRDSWRTAVFGDLFEVANVTEIKSLAQYDAPPPLRTALGEEGYKAYQAKMGAMADSARTYAIRTRPDLSYIPDPAYEPKMAILTRVEVNADKLADFETFIKNDWIPALKQGGGKYYAVSQVVYGGTTTLYFTLVGIDTFADLEKGHPVTRAIGEDGLMKLMTRIGGFEHHIERNIIRLDPDLSFEVKATSDAR
jgi:hypothetical protein